MGFEENSRPRRPNAVYHMAPPNPLNRNMYDTPKSPVLAFLWRKKIWFEVSFNMSMLEPWEEILILSILCLLLALLITGVVQYMPQHLSIMQERVIYYLWGEDGIISGYGAGQ